MDELTRRNAANLLLVSPAVAFGSQANSAVTFGIIGAGGRGRYVGTHMANDKRTRLTAICDLFPDRIDLAKTQVPGADKARVFKDYRELLALSGLDAVLIATPVFLHPEHFEAAVDARQHIYCEKPAGADVAGVKRLMRAAARADKSKTRQFGFQQRFSPEYLTAERMINEGKIGQVTLVTSYWVLGNRPPAQFKSPYDPKDQKLRHWGHWQDYSGGPIVEQDCHGVDVLNWFSKAHPERATGTGGLRYKPPYGDWTSDHHNITYFYPGNIEGWLISIKHTGGFRDVREQVFGSAGMIETARTYYRYHGPIPTSALVNADDLADRSLIEKVDSKREITIDAVEAFFTSIIGKKPIDMSTLAAEATLTSLLGRMAFETRREVTWKEMMQSA